MKLIYPILLITLAAACGTGQKLTPDAYVRHMNSNESDLLVVKELNGINYKLRLLTPEYMALSQSRGSANKNDVEEYLKNYGNQATFIFVIEDVDKHQGHVKSKVFNNESYGAILSYANTDLKNDFILVREADTVYCNLVHLEPANSLQPVIRLSLAFNIPPARAKGFTFLFNDNIFNNGPLKFTYSNQVMDNLPELKL